MKSNKTGRQRCFGRRERSLKKLHFSSYLEYLHSPLWRRIRTEKLSKHPLCFYCKNVATEVHHLRYTQSVLLGENLGALVSLCRKCHQEISDAAKVTKVHEETVFSERNRINNNYIKNLGILKPNKIGKRQEPEGEIRR